MKFVEKSGDHKWLCVEKDENDRTKYSLYTKYKRRINEKEKFLNIDGIKYEVYEKGIATVKNYFGNADVDIYENCVYIDYISSDKKNIVSIEKWEDEIEKSIGEYLDDSRVVITNELDIERIKKIYREDKKSKKSKWNFLIIVMIILMLCNSPTLFSDLFANKSIEKYLEKQTKISVPKYYYETSITNNSDNSKKARLYKSNLKSIDAVVKDIINGVHEGITDIIDYDPDTEEDGIGVYTKNEFVYIYMEDNDVYVQVSGKGYVNKGGTLYHGGNHNTYYHRTYNSTRKSTVYSNYRYSARQNSINSRKTSGGGTSSGK